MDTKYDNVNTFRDLFEKNDSVEDELEEKSGKTVRFEDKTSEEISNDIKKKRRVQMSKLNQIRTYQLFIMVGVAFGYLFVYRRFFATKSVMNSAIYN